jgi:hypothetical protein
MLGLFSMKSSIVRVAKRRVMRVHFLNECQLFVCCPRLTDTARGQGQGRQCPRAVSVRRGQHTKRWHSFKKWTTGQKVAISLKPSDCHLKSYRPLQKVDISWDEEHDLDRTRQGQKKFRFLHHMSSTTYSELPARAYDFCPFCLRACPNETPRIYFSQIPKSPNPSRPRDNRRAIGPDSCKPLALSWTR